MAYSDYGGYAYRNGVRVEDRSDAVITPELANIGSPGIFPGFVALAAGQSVEQFEQTRRTSVDGHVVLGDGPVFVAMYKQSYMEAFRLINGAFVACHETKDVSGYQLAEDEAPMISIEVDGYVIDALFERTDNYYQYVRLTQPDGTVWTGFSGYGVGAGLEDCGYGFSTDDQVERLQDLFPAGAA